MTDDIHARRGQRAEMASGLMIALNEWKDAGGSISTVQLHFNTWVDFRVAAMIEDRMELALKIAAENRQMIEKLGAEIEKLRQPPDIDLPDAGAGAVFFGDSAGGRLRYVISDLVTLTVMLSSHNHHALALKVSAAADTLDAVLEDDDAADWVDEPWPTRRAGMTFEPVAEELKSPPDMAVDDTDPPTIGGVLTRTRLIFTSLAAWYNGREAFAAATSAQAIAGQIDNFLCSDEVQGVADERLVDADRRPRPTATEVSLTQHLNPRISGAMLDELVGLFAADPLSAPADDTAFEDGSTWRRHYDRLRELVRPFIPVREEPKS